MPLSICPLFRFDKRGRWIARLVRQPGRSCKEGRKVTFSLPPFPRLKNAGYPIIYHLVITRPVRVIHVIEARRGDNVGTWIARTGRAMTIKTGVFPHSNSYYDLRFLSSLNHRHSVSLHSNGGTHALSLRL